MNNKVNIFLTGGGAKGSFQIGFFKALEEFEIKPNAIYGSSVGALVGGAATYMDSYDMLECFKTLTLESVLEVDSNKFKDIHGSLKTLKLYKETFLSCMKNRLIDIENIRTLLYNSLDGEQIKSSKIDFGITTSVLPTFKSLQIYKEEMITNPLEYILASLYLPIFRSQKIIDNKNYIDIADYKHFPFEMLKKKECSNIYIVNISSGSSNKLYKDIEKAKFNESIKITVINMDYKASILDFSEEQMLVNYNKGYETTRKVLSKIM